MPCTSLAPSGTGSEGFSTASVAAAGAEAGVVDAMVRGARSGRVTIHEVTLPHDGGGVFFSSTLPWSVGYAHLFGRGGKGTG